MAKRKRDDQDTDTPTPTIPPDSFPDKKTAKQVKKLYKLIESTAATLHDALKTARRFERQKLGRRIKTARASNNRQQWNRLEDEVVVLKNIDLDLIASRHVYKSLAKTKRIAEHPAFKRLRVSDALAAPPASPEEANVTARLYNSNPVKNAMPDFVAEAKALLAVGVDSALKKEPEKGRGDAPDIDRDEESDDDEENTYSARDSRIASSSSSPSESDRESDRESDQEDDKTTLLPPLTMGGYWSGSESEPEDDLPELGGGRNGQPERKNRMGQQARRALWEKKFGKEANHLKKQMQKQKQKQNQKQKKGGKRDEGWDLRRGATAPDDRRDRKDRKDGKERTQRQRPASLDEHRPKKQKMQDDKPVHPSWEAKRKAREAMAAKMSGFQGKKVVFD